MDPRLEEFEREIKAIIVRSLTPEQRLEGLTPEERVQGLSLQDRLKGLPIPPVTIQALQTQLQESCPAKPD